MKYTTTTISIVTKKYQYKNPTLRYMQAEKPFVPLKEEREQEVSFWHENLVKLTKDNNNNDIEDIISTLIQCSQENRTRNKYEDCLNKARFAYDRYVSETEENEKNKFPSPSCDSLFQLARFIPELPEKNLEVFLDEMTGCFGVIIKVNTTGNPILNLLMKENKEIIFSFIKRKNKIIKISGRAYFNDHLDDSDEIKHLIGMINL